MVDRDEIHAAVLADVAAGMTLRAAARKHGVPSGTVAVWWKRARDRGEAPERVVVKAERLPELKLAKAEKAAKAPRARAAAKAEAQDKNAAPTPARAREPKRPVVELIGPELRKSLRTGVAGLARYIARAGESVNPDGDIDADMLPDMQQVAHAARALDILVARVPDLMTFDESTAEKAATDAAALAQRAVDVFGALDQPGGLTVVDGGKAATG